MESELNVASQYDYTLKSLYTPVGLSVHVRYDSTREFPSPHIIIGWEEWDRFVAWVELHRKEEALEKYKESLHPPKN